MGIQGLLPFLKKSSRQASLQDFKGQTAAIDAYCWLHKGAFSCADKLVRGEPTDGYVLYVMKQINQLLNYNIKPILVFDGCHLPSKAITEAKRRENRDRNRKKAKELLREGKSKEARECFQRCVDVTSEMAADVINACRARNIDIIVAPYEADAQLAYLNQCGIAQLIITEDSDLILFGCKTILFKMDNNGGGVLVEQEKLHLCMNVPRDKFCFDKFRNMCILSGCDYLPSLHGIGLAKACKFFTVTSNPDIYNVLCKLPAYLKMPQLEVTKEYREGFIKARNTFLYQLVFDPVKRLLVPLSEYPPDKDAEDFPYAGNFVGHDRGLQIALGNVNVQTGEIVDNFDPQTFKPPKPKSSSWEKFGDVISASPSIWKQGFTPTKPALPVPSLHNSERATTKGKEIVVTTPIVRTKRKSECEEADNELSDRDLASLYAVPEKRLKTEVSSSPENQNTSTVEHQKSSETTFEKDDLDDFILENESMDTTPQHDNATSPKARKSRNPFAKTQSPSKKESLVARNFSALGRFSEMKKVQAESKTVFQSKYFTSAKPKLSSPEISESQFEISSAAELPSISEASECEASSHETSQEEIKPFQNLPQNDESPDSENGRTVPSPPPPLSILETNTLSNQSHFKWSSLSERFANTKSSISIGKSPASKIPFKSFSNQSNSVVESKEIKENNISLSQISNDQESTVASQKSTSSGFSECSNTDSIDNESFGLTPVSSLPSTPECHEGSILQQTSSTSSPPKILSPLGTRKPFSSSKSCRAPGLSRRGGGKNQKKDGKQLSLRDMFGFKKDQPKLQSTRPSV